MQPTFHLNFCTTSRFFKKVHIQCYIFFRSRLMGWPPRWVRDQPESNNSNQRALPPVPSSQTESNRADHIPDEDERVSTPELRPEDFPPGKYYFFYKN